MPTPSTQPLLSVPAVAALLAVHADTVRELIHARRISAIKVGRHYRIRPAAVEEYLQHQFNTRKGAQ